MSKNFKPSGYNSISPYIVVDGAQKLIDLLKQVFNATELRRYDLPNGKIMHAEVMIDDSVIMLGDSSEQYGANTSLIHVYVADAKTTYNKAIEAGCTGMTEPVQKEGDPDLRGMFVDFAGNTWAVGTQV